MIGSWGIKTIHVPSAVSSLCSVVLLEEMVGTVVLGLHIIFIITWGCANCFLDMLKYMILFICFERACYSLDLCLWKFGKMKVTWKLHSEVLTCILKSDMNYSYHLNLNRFYLKRKMLEIHLLAKFSVLPFGEYFINIELILFDLH